MKTKNKIAYLVRFSIYLSIILYGIFGNELGVEICTFKRVFGLDCFTCGLTRAFMNFFRFNFTKAFNFNPLIVIVMPLFLFIVIDDVYSLIYYLKTKKFRPSFVGFYFGV